MSVIISDDFNQIKLLEPVQGRVNFFNKVMDSLQEAQDRAFDAGKPAMSALILGKKIENVGGYFTNGKYVPRIVLPADVADYDEQNNTIKFKDEYGFAAFVHEASHFLHLLLDEGKYTAKSLRDHKPANINSRSAYTNQNIVRDDEYEAGWRSLVYNNIYDMDLKDKIFEVNRNNMMIYIDKPQIANDIRKRLNQAINDAYKAYNNDIELVNDFISTKVNPTLDACQNVVNEAHQTWAKSLTKFSELADYQNKLTLTTDQAKSIEDSLVALENQIKSITPTQPTVQNNPNDADDNTTESGHVIPGVQI